MREWIELRIVELQKRGKKKTKGGLMKALGLPSTRFSEIKKGKRTIQTKEIDTVATYLEMSREDVMRLEKASKGAGEARAPAVDRVVLQQVIQLVGEVLESQGLRPSPADLAIILANLYEELIDAAPDSARAYLMSEQHVLHRLQLVSAGGTLEHRRPMARDPRGPRKGGRSGKARKSP